MDSELLDKILPSLGVLLGAIIGFAGNYILNTQEFKKQKLVRKEEHLKELLSQFISGLNGLLNLSDDIIEALIQLHNTKLTKKVEDEYESIINKSMSDVNSSLIEFKSLNMKYDFATALNISILMEQFKNDFREFTEYLSALDSKRSHFLIEDDDLLYLKSLHNSNYDIRVAVEEKIRLFYSSKFLPNK